MRDRLWYLKSSPLFCRLSEPDLAQLEQTSQARWFDRKSIVYLPAEVADEVFLVVQGRIRLYTVTPDGKEASLAFVDPGELFGELSVVAPGPREEFAEAMERTQLVRIRARALESLVQQRPELAFAITRLVGFRRLRVERRLKSLLFQSHRDRLVHLLLELAERYGRQVRGDVELGIALSHQELANLIGSTRESVTVGLGELQRSGWIRVQRKRLVISQMALLADSVGQRPPVLKPSSA